jgi:2,4-dienoyl-CoA reductase-like NADH-dependent reductase (Old Yellow Enzyme family)/thioredoxin reductase
LYSRGRGKRGSIKIIKESLMKFSHLFEPFQLGSIKLKNRLVMSPMTMNYATEEGFATEKLIHHYLERAQGGVGLIMVEGTFFRQEGKGYKNQLGLSSSGHAQKLSELTDKVHGLRNEARIFIQIHHAGGRAYSKVTGLQPVAPSALVAYPGAELPRALTREEVRELIDAHVQAAVWAREAGFDGVDIHCAHGYLVPSFFSPLSNKRTDEYGGDLNGRARFLLETIRGIKDRLGRDFPLTIKISGDEFIEGGLGLLEMIQIAQLAEEAGIDGVTVSAGSVGAKKIGDLSRAHQILRTLPMMTEHGCLVPLAAEMKRVLRIPVITVGRINQPALAEEIIAEGRADLVAMGRPLLADPYLPQKVLEGREDEIRSCIACNEGCYKRIFQQLDIRCAVNPTVGRGEEIVCGRVTVPKKVFVIGAGPGGLEAAHAAWKRGHRVILVEKSRELGGQLNLASVPPGRKEIGRFKEFLLKRLQRTDIEVFKGKRAIMPLLRKNQPDVLILATGASPRNLNIPGLEETGAMNAWEVLAGKRRPRGPCLILGAGLVGCETADTLSEKGVKTVLVEILPEIATGADADTKAYFEMRFKKNGVEVYTGAALQQMKGKTAVLEHREGEVRIEVGTVIFSVGPLPNDGLVGELTASGVPIKMLGDCVKPRTILDAVREGFEIGNNI